MCKDISSVVIPPLPSTVVKIEDHHPPSSNGGVVRSDSWQATGKIFKIRNSLLTDAYNTIPHIQSIRHLVWLFLISWQIGVPLIDCVEGTTPIKIPGLETLQIGLHNAHIAIVVWIAMLVTTVLSYVVFSLWAILRSKLASGPRRVFDNFSFVVALAFLGLFECLPIWVIFQLDIGCLLRGVLAGEKARLLLKIIAFWYSKASEALQDTKENDSPVDSKVQENQNLPKRSYPKFSCFAYFLFAPTLMYNDNYPRTEKIRWRFFFMNLTECFFCLFTAASLVESNLPLAREVTKVLPKNFALLLGYTLRYMMKCTVVFLIGMHAILHSLQNTFAELLRFADRQFYLDWWNQNSFILLFRMMNVIVQDWLFFHIYRPIRVWTGNRLFAHLSVFVISALEHEVIMTTAFGFVYPVLACSFLFTGGVLTLFTAIPGNKSFGNFVFLSLCTFGFGACGILLTAESFARINCPEPMDSFWESLLPRTFFCTTTKQI